MHGIARFGARRGVVVMRGHGLRLGLYQPLTACARLTLTAFIVLLMNCATARPSSLAGSEWRPAHMGSIAIPAGTALFVQFMDKGKLAGFGGCNHFSGEYMLADRAVRITIREITGMHCAGAIGDLEIAFIETLRSAAAFERRHVVLVLFDQNNREIASFAQTDWD
jgi:heat shock protein HslJ